MTSVNPASHHGKQGHEDDIQAGLDAPPIFIDCIDALVIEPEMRVHAVGKDGELQRAGIEANTARQLVKELACYSLKGDIDQGVDVWRSGRELASGVHEVIWAEAIGAGQPEEVVGIEVPAAQEGGDEGVCIHEGEGEEIQHASSIPPSARHVKVETCTTLIGPAGGYRPPCCVSWASLGAGTLALLEGQGLGATFLCRCINDCLCVELGLQRLNAGQ